jgi:hypothetical protein
MSETRSARWVGLGLGLVLTLVFALNAVSRTEAETAAKADPAVLASR